MGTQSGRSPPAMQAWAVADPIATTTRPTSARTSRSIRARPSSRARAPRGLDTITPAWPERSARIRSSASRWSSGAGPNSRQGTTATSAPAAPMRRASVADESAARVMTIRWPKSGRRSSQAICSRRFTTSPTTMIAGERRSAAAIRSPMSAKVPTKVRWIPRVPQRTSAVGVAGSRPASISLAALVAALRTDIIKTSVPALRARCFHATAKPLLS